MLSNDCLNHQGHDVKLLDSFSSMSGEIRSALSRGDSVEEGFESFGGDTAKFRGKGELRVHQAGEGVEGMNFADLVGEH